MAPTGEHHALALLVEFAQHFGLGETRLTYQRQTANPGSIPLCREKVRPGTGREAGLGHAPVSRRPGMAGSDRPWAPYFSGVYRSHGLHLIPTTSFTIFILN